MDWKILVVDDHSGMRAFMRMALASAEYHVVEATDGSEAIDLAAREQPHLILMDIMMPQMDGFTACEILRKQNGTAHIPIILQSSLTTPEHQRKSQALGATHYMEKPLSFDDLLAVVNTYLLSSSP